jgi:hypothetical protein
LFRRFLLQRSNIFIAHEDSVRFGSQGWVALARKWASLFQRFLLQRSNIFIALEDSARLRS